MPRDDESRTSASRLPSALQTSSPTARHGDDVPRRSGPARKAASAAAVFLTLSALCACEAIGPGTIYAGRDRYNEAFHDTNKDQLLQNIVRLRYDEPMLFLDITSIASTEVLAGNIGASAGYTRPGHVRNLGANAGVSYTESPTVIYEPLQGGKFVTQLMTPVSIEILALLLQAGWSFDRIFLLLVEQVNGVQNASSGAGPSPTEPPEYKAYQAVIRQMQALQQEDKLHLLITQGPDGKPQAILSIAGGLGSDPRGQELARLLDLDPSAESIPIVRTPQRTRNQISIVTRSLIAAGYFIGQSIEVPQRDVDAKSVRVAVNPDGSRFDWAKVYGPLFRVHSVSGGGRPSNAFAAAEKGDTWFYIADSDIDAKRTFTLYTMVLSLLSGESQAGRPLLTLPASGR